MQNTNYREQYKSTAERNNARTLETWNNTNNPVTENNCKKYN